ncbi:MAG: pitrilysin family protein [Gammaproteobacteria bacterium]|jgi:zinc protease|nr:pitrilysin family protein [Gammaproteobacteria bacterium]HJP36441.1 pitrilysin family protein [Gammaproteobacteria bacterium]
MKRLIRALAGIFLFAVPAVQAVPTIQHWVTDNGARVLFVEAPEIPIVDVRFVFGAGSSRDQSNSGLAQLVSRLLREGAGALDANAFNEQLAATGAVFSTGALRDMAWVSLRSLSDQQYLAPALKLLQAVLSSPRFDGDAIERSKANTLVEIRREQQSPSKIASKAFYKAVYGDHPYASPMRGTETSVSAMSRDDIVGFNSRYYVAQNATVAIVGSLSRTQAERIAADLSASMAAGEAARALSPVPMLPEAASHHIEFPSIQSHVRIGQPGLKRGDPDYFPLLVGNHILGGGGLVSILFDEVREKRGLSYSVNSYFSPMAELGPFTASLQTDNSQQDEAITVLRNELDKFITNGPTPEALQAAKQNLIGGFPLRIASNSKTVEYLAMIGFYRLPLDYLQTFTGHVAAVTIEDVRSAFRRRLDPAKMIMVVVGRSNSEDG